MSDQQNGLEELKTRMRAVIDEQNEVADPWDEPTGVERRVRQDHVIKQLQDQIKRLQDALNDRDRVIRELRSRIDFNESGVGAIARKKIRECVGAMSGEATHDAVVRRVRELDGAHRHRILERELERVTGKNQFHMDEVENLGQTLTERDTQIQELRGTIQERDRVIQNQRNHIEILQAEAEVRNCSEPYRQTNVELQEQVRRLTERGEHDRTQLQKELVGAWEMNGNLQRELDARSRLVDLLTQALGDIGTVVTKVVDKLPLNADE